MVDGWYLAIKVIGLMLVIASVDFGLAAMIRGGRESVDRDS